MSLDHLKAKKKFFQKSFFRCHPNSMLQNTTMRSEKVTFLQKGAKLGPQTNFVRWVHPLWSCFIMQDLCAFTCGSTIFKNLSFFFMSKKCFPFLSGENLAVIVILLWSGHFSCPTPPIVARDWILWVCTMYHKWPFYFVKKIVIKLTYLDILLHKVNKPNQVD